MIKIKCTVCKRLNTYQSLREFSNGPKHCSACNLPLAISNEEIPTESDRDDETDPEHVLVDGKLIDSVALPSLDDVKPTTTPSYGQDTPKPIASPLLDHDVLRAAELLVTHASALPRVSSEIVSSSAPDPTTTGLGFRVTYTETDIPEFVDFETKDGAWSEWVTHHRLEVIAELPIEPASDDEISIPITIKTKLGGSKVAVWLRRGNRVGNGEGIYRYTTDSSCQVSIKLDKAMRHFELCIRAANAKNWLWCVTVPVLRRTDIDKVPRSYHFDQTRHVATGATVLEGYTNNQITIVDNATAQATTRQFGLILEPQPLKPRTSHPNRFVCPRRKRPVSEFTLSCGKSQWHLHGGSTLTFGKDKPLPDRDNQNDMVFRPHRSEKIWGQVSRTHGTFEVSDTEVFYQHASTPQGIQRNKKITAVFAGKTEEITQPNGFKIPDPLEAVRFQPVLSVAASQAESLEIQAWRHSVDYDQYRSTPPTKDVVPRGAIGPLRLSVLRVNIISPEAEVVRQHFLISKSLIIGSSDRAQIQVKGEGIRSFHGYIHWVDNHLWLEVYNAQCQIKVDGQQLYVHQLSPLTEEVEVVLGDSSVLQILHYG